MIRNFLRMLRLCRPHWRLYLVGTLALVLVDVLDTFTPKITQWAIDHVGAVLRGEAPSSPFLSMVPGSWIEPGTPGQGMWVYGALAVATVAITGFFRYFMSISFARASVRLTHELRGRLYGHVQRLDAGYHDRSKVGDQMSRATNDSEACRMFYGIGLLILFDTILYFFLVPSYMLTISWKLTLASSITLPLIPLIVSRLTQTVESRFEKVQEQFSALSERARESFSGAKVIKSFAREEAEVGSFAGLAREYMVRGLRFMKVLALEHPLMALMLGLADLVVVVYGGALVIAGEITVGQFAAFFQYLLRLSGPMIGLGWTIMLYQRGRVGMGRIEEVLAVRPAIVEPEDPVPVEDLAGHVRVEGLTFSYRNDAEPALRDLSFTLAPGRTLGIVGPVGSGKSTLLHLLPRLYDPPDGTIFLDGHDVRRIPLGVLRTRIGIVPQETFLFSETIRENIALGAPGEVPEGLVEESARRARFDDEIRELPAGYETLLGERGVNLSGGQKQRVAIARALARRPRILLLDDCLSSVDTRTEAEILTNLKEVTRGLTTIVVSHRVGTVRHADEILVLERGRVIERGTHDRLAAAGGRYAELARRQAGEGEA